jgi:tetratricopeptide (TPR) repeat protein
MCDDETRKSRNVNSTQGQLNVAVTALLIFLSAAGALGQAPSAGGGKAASDYSKEAYVVEKLRTVVIFENDGTSSRTTTCAVRVQSEAGVQHWGVIAAGYSSANERVEIGYVRVRKADGTVVETPADSAQDLTSEIMRVAPMYSDYHEKHVAVKGLGVGDVLEYEITVRLQTPLIPGQFWFAYDFDKTAIVLDEEVEANLPKEREVKVKGPDLKPVMAEVGNRRVCTWKTSNHEVRKNDEARREFPPPDILLSSFTSWDELARWWSGLEQQGITPTPEVRAKAAELTRNSATREEKVRALYDYVALRFHYISISFGIGRYQPHAAVEVLKNEYGDCKDKHVLLASLLEAVGIEAYPVLMNSARHIDPDVPSPGQFDHVITAVPEAPKGSKLTWLDTTTEVAPFGFLIFALRDKQALVIPGAAPPLLVNTPADPPFKTFRHFEIDAKLSDSGVLEGKMQRSYRGDSELLLRMLFRQVPQSQWKDAAQGIAQGMGYAGEVSDVEVGSLEATNEAFHFSNKYIRKDYPDWANHRITAPVGVVGFAEIKEGETRTQPILLGGPEEITSIARVELPKGYHPELLPGLDLVRDFAEYHSSYAFKDGIFVAEVRLVIKKREVPLAALDDYRGFQKAVSDNQNLYTELVTGAKLAYTPTPSRKGDAVGLYLIAWQAVQRRDLEKASDALERALKLDEQYKDAWLLLGGVRLTQGRTHEGAAAMRKAIEIDPKDTRIYKEMVRSPYLRTHPEETILVWREIVKADPNDVDARSNLAHILVNLKRYDEAVTELEAAVALSKPNPWLNLDLANAYIGDGRKDKAVATLTKAAESALDPWIWNNAAYTLADNNLSLADAQRYAQKAVKSVEDDAAKVSLDKLEVADLNRMLQIAYCWGTLGWVYFREGDFEKAQKYLEAAWNLEQDKDIGEHLAETYKRFAETYKKQGNKAAADHQESLARHLAVEDLSRMRRTPLGKLSVKPGSAEFFVLLVNGGTVEEVNFISGDGQIRPLSKALASLKFKAPLPDEAPVKLVRRGVLVCQGSGLGCDFTLFTVDSVHSVE